MAEDWNEYFEKRLGDFKEEIIHQFHIISEDVITKVQQVAEGVVNLDQKFDRRLDGLDRKIEKKSGCAGCDQVFLCRTRSANYVSHRIEI
jgi:hypothetical protein